MDADVIVRASTIITMEQDAPRAEAVAIDTSTGTIVAVGTLTECQAVAPGVQVTDLGETVLMPGFIEAHSHPLVGGISTQEPAHWMSPAKGFTTYAQVTALWRTLNDTLPADVPVICYGLDRLNQGAPELSNADLDEYFPDRPAVVLEISGHEAYFNTATIRLNQWSDDRPPADPPASRFGRNPDGTSNGRAYETAAVVAATGAVIKKAVPHPLMSVARWYRILAEAGITTTAENTFATSLLKSYLALASVPDTPMRVGFYHVGTEPDATEPLPDSVPPRLWKAGLKLWADGSTFNGTLAASFAFNDNQTTRTAEIPLGPSAESMMNFTRAELDALLDRLADSGLQIGVHAHGDVAIDIVLDAFGSALTRHRLLGTDHRWRIEHWSAGRADQFRRAVDLGVCVPLSVYQFLYVGDLLDGTLLPSEIGSQWVAAGDALRAGARISFHADSPVAPPTPLLNVQSMVTRRTASGQLHGPNQAVTLDEALRAITINGAFHMHRDHDLGSIKAGKLADFVELSADPYAVDVNRLAADVKVLGTWSHGRKIDLDQFLAQVEQLDPSGHEHLHSAALRTHHC